MILLRYFTRLFASRFLAVLLALSALVELIAMLDALRHLVGHHAGFRNVLIFSLYQFPMALEQLFPLAVLIGATLTFRALAQSSEMIVLRGAGMSPYRVLWCLLPAVLLLAGAYYAIVDNVAPRSERAFAVWWHDVIQAADDEEQAPKGAIWLRVGSEIVSVGAVNHGGAELTDLTRYLRDNKNNIVARIHAAHARLVGGTWHLTDVTSLRLYPQHGNGGVFSPSPGRGPASAPQQTVLPDMIWQNGPPALNFEELALPTRRMQSTEGRQVLAGTWAGAAGAAHYRTLVQKSLAAPLLPLLMLLLAMPALTGTGRRATVRGMAVSIGMGLLFLVVNGFFSSMSESAVLPPVIAVWTAPLVFLALGFTQLLRNEE